MSIQPSDKLQMSYYYKYPKKKEFAPPLEERFVRTMSGQIANDEKIELRIPAWMKDELQAKIGKKNISEYVRALILGDFIERGIQEPVTEEVLQNRILEMKNFP